RGRWLELELKIIADVGIIGVPNAGKSSFLYAVTEKKPRIAAYPFTTTVPNLGYYDYDVHGGITLCDVPGLIEGASEGRGMGFMFLRHVERCQTLIHVIAGDSEDPIGDFETIQKELRDYSTEVAMKPQVIVVNKCDLPEVQERLPALMKELRRRCGHTRVFNISAATRYNTDELMERVYKWHQSVVRKEWDENGSPASDATHVVGRRELTQLGGKVEEVGRGEPVELDKALPSGRRQKSEFQAKVEWDVIDEAWRVIHPEVEQVALRTDWTYTGGYDRLNSIMKKTGASEALKQTGVKEGEIVIVGNTKFSYNPEMVGKEANMLYGQLELKTVKEEDYKEKNPARM
ncbi:OBGL, partial [Symbiodinium sp. KB8]